MPSHTARVTRRRCPRTLTARTWLAPFAASSVVAAFRSRLRTAGWCPPRCVRRMTSRRRSTSCRQLDARSSGLAAKMRAWTLPSCLDSLLTGQFADATWRRAAIWIRRHRRRTAEDVRLRAAREIFQRATRSGRLAELGTPIRVPSFCA
jgi:hypothetical protein